MIHITHNLFFLFSSISSRQMSKSHFTIVVIRIFNNDGKKKTSTIKQSISMSLSINSVGSANKSIVDCMHSLTHAHTIDQFWDYARFIYLNVSTPSNKMLIYSLQDTHTFMQYANLYAIFVSVLEFSDVFLYIVQRTVTTYFKYHITFLLAQYKYTKKNCIVA